MTHFEIIFYAMVKHFLQREESKHDALVMLENHIADEVFIEMHDFDPLSGGCCFGIPQFRYDFSRSF